MVLSKRNNHLPEKQNFPDCYSYLACCRRCWWHFQSCNCLWNSQSRQWTTNFTFLYKFQIPVSYGDQSWIKHTAHCPWLSRIISDHLYWQSVTTPQVWHISLICISHLSFIGNKQWVTHVTKATCESVQSSFITCMWRVTGWGNASSADVSSDQSVVAPHVLESFAITLAQSSWPLQSVKVRQEEMILNCWTETVVSGMSHLCVLTS